MNIIILFAIIVLYILLFCYTNHNALVSIAIISVINLYFPQYISIYGMQISTLLNLFSLCYCLYYIKQTTCFPNEVKAESCIFLIYLFLLLLWGIFNGTILSSMQLSGFKRAIFQFSIASFCFLIINSPKRIKQFWYVMVIFLYILTVYGIFCYSTQTNIIMAAFNIAYNPTDSILEQFSMEVRGGLEGRIQGFMTHPLGYGGILIVSFFYILHSFSWLSELQKKMVYPLLITLLINVFLCGSRSAMIGLFVGFFLYFIVYLPARYKRHTIASFIIIYLFLFIIGKTNILSNYNDYINSIVFFWKDNDNVHGSGFDLRLLQLEATFDLISHDPITFLFGKGDQWCANYSMNHGGLHPKLLGFESIVFIGLIQYGIIGFVLLTCGLYYKLLRFGLKFTSNSIVPIFLLSFFIFQLFTGDYAWLPFLTTYLIMIKTDIVNASSKTIIST